jgi:3D (Asp-Asp-Asp) domain-containing protein
MVLGRSLWRKALVTAIAVAGFVSTYEVTILDSRHAARRADQREATAAPWLGSRLAFSATAYCKGTITRSGVPPRTGVLAADPILLPLGSVVRLDSLPDRYNGIYTVMDTGPAIQGRIVDIYMWSCYEALDFGRRPAHVTVLRLGWSPAPRDVAVADTPFKRLSPARLVPLPQSPEASP